MNNQALPRFWVIIPAAGFGSRMKTDKPKQYVSLGNKTIIEHTLDCFLAHPCLQGIVVCISAIDSDWQTLQIKHPLIQQTIGGKERIHSVIAGLEYLKNQLKPNDWVLVHDAARPNLKRQDLDKLLSVLQHDEVGGLLATKVKDTLKKADSNGRVIATIDRSTIWQALTPQMFRYDTLLQALTQAVATDKVVTDEASAMELAGYAPLLVEGRSDNIKVTYPEDILQLKPYF